MSTLKRKNGALDGGSEAKKTKPNASIASFFGAAPKTTSATSTTGPGKEPASPSFDKEKWVATLTPEQKELLQLEIDTLHESWLALLKDDIVQKDFLDLKRFLRQETKNGRKFFPPQQDIYSWSRHTPFNSIKVVILGQDPYHNDNQAHGMAFSVRPPTPAPPSLRNIYICLKKDYPAFVTPPNRAGLLTPWADRGVLMLNTCLTVRAHEAFSHANRGWERFTGRVLELVAKRRTRGVVFMAWGTPAGKRVRGIDKQRHLILESVHPSPLSASRGFFDCGHFKKANDWLVGRYGDGGEIDWALAPGNTTKEKPDPETEKVEEEKAEQAQKEAEVSAEDSVKSAAKDAKALSGSADFDNGITSDDEEALEEALKLVEDEDAKAKAKATA